MLKFWGGKYRTLNTIKVDGQALLHNLNVYRQLHPGKAICPVLKANAYGHGLVEVAQALDPEEPDFFIVDSLYEAYELQKAKIETPILVLGYTFGENLSLKKLPFHFAVSDFETAKILIKQEANIHLKVDTGMNRMGFRVEDLHDVLPKLKSLDAKIVGLLTHFADSDNPTDLSYDEMQFGKFREVIKQVKESGFNPEWIHGGGASGVGISSGTEPINMIRLGLSLYGISPLEPGDARTESLKNLKPAMEVVSTLVGIHHLKAGDRVSYNGTFTAESAMTIGMVPFGYYEGLPRALSNRGCMEVKGKTCPIVGRVCMNYTMVDVTGLDARVGDSVVVYSNDPEKPNTFKKLGKLADTISYELVVRLAESVRREVI